MSLHCRTVDQHLRRRTTGRSQGMEDGLPNPFGRPAHEAIVERLARAIDGRRIDPAAAGFEHMNNPANDAPIIDLGLPRVSVGRFGSSRANCSALSQNPSRSIDGLPSETLNQKTPGLKSPFMGPEPYASVAKCCPELSADLN